MAQSSFGQFRDQLRLAWLALAALALLPGVTLAQQPATLTGRVTTEAGQPLSSAAIVIEQLGAGATTRADGSYTILIPGARVPSGPVTVTARLYDSHGKLLATRSAKTLLSAVPSHGRVPFSIDGSWVPGYARASYSVSAPATSGLGAPTITVKTNALNSAGQRVVNGTVKNPYSTTITSFGVAVTLYDGRAGVLDVKRAAVGATKLAPGASTTFSAAFLAPGLMPLRTYVRGLVHR